MHLVDTQELLLANGNSSVVKQNLENISNGHKVLENDNGKMERIYSCIEEEDEDDDTNVTQGSTHL